MSTNRRTLLGTIAGVAVLAGCLGDINEENPGSDEETDDESMDASEDESQEDEDRVGEGEETDAEDDLTEDETDEEMAEVGVDDEAADESMTEEELIGLIGSILDEEGLVVDTIGRRDNTLEIAYIATGTTSDAVTTEIEIVADVYVRAINSGLTTERLAAFVLGPEEGDVMDSFVIETDWVVAYTNEEIGWDEYVDRIAETFE